MYMHIIYLLLFLFIRHWTVFFDMCRWLDYEHLMCVHVMVNFVRNCGCQNSQWLTILVTWSCMWLSLNISRLLLLNCYKGKDQYDDWNHLIAPYQESNGDKRVKQFSWSRHKKSLDPSGQGKEIFFRTIPLPSQEEWFFFSSSKDGYNSTGSKI